MKRRLLLWIVLAVTLHALACALPFTTSPEDSATQIAADIYATATAESALPAYDAQLPGPSTVHIAADGSRDYPTLEEALAAVPPESTILLDPGTYHLKLKLEIDKTISLRGAGMDQTIIVGNDATYVIRFTGPGKFTLQGITLRYEGTPWANVVSVKDGDIDFSDCRFTGGVYDDNENKGGAGLFTSGNTSGEIADCRSEDNGLHGFNLRDDSNLTLERNICSNNSQTGIIYWQNSGGLANENNCLNNGLNGIEVREQAQPTLEGNTCQGNTYNGILFNDNSRGVVRENQIMQNGQHGIRLKGDAAPTLKSNIIKDNQENGIAYFGNAGGTARQNEISGNLECITVEENANPELINNSCDGSATSEPTFGAIIFAMGVSEDEQPINPMTEFPKGVTKIFGVFEFQGMSDGCHWSAIFFRNGKEYASASRVWDHGANGITFADLYYPDGKSLRSGNYKLKLFVGDKLMQSGKFKIGK